MELFNFCFIKITETADISSDFTIGLFWLIDRGYTMDGLLIIQERANIDSCYEVWKSIARSPDLTSYDFSL